jgi:septal ring factor EnvC (AmiA/AmiB activator)
VKPEERAVLESMQLHLKELSSDMADAVAAVTETSRSLAQLGNTLQALTGKLAELYDQQNEQNERINRYILDKARDDGRIGRLEKHVGDIARIIESAGA